ncbi:phage regulatory protein/antirepressor Ant [Carnobacterium pleistocenium]|uniref:phage regulatory protein/antirepressor Ant n=1 Tax=Carnobacterium pleistocenium TaxID=181073 RepID=UPI00055802A8|nr:phage regulatory protein/antirepressor Ant [Carnobacterium pleistocenium]
MSNLVIMKNRQALTTSLQIAVDFEKEHYDVIKSINRLKEDVGSFSEMFVEDSEPDSYGRPRKIYFMNRDGFVLLAMGYNGKKALDFKMKYIQAFNQMETQLIEQAKDSYMIEDPVKRAEKWIQERKQVQQLELENSQLKPKAIFADSVAASDTSILINDLAKLLKQNGIEIGGTRLFAWLRETGYLIKRKGTDYNMPTQKSMELELFQIKETAINHNSGRISISRTPKVTGKGQLYFINKFITAKNKIGIEG